MYSVKKHNAHTEGVFSNFYEAQESIPPAQIAWQAGKTTIFVLGF
jgi:hypothetical protein